MLLIADHISLATEHTKTSGERAKLARENLDLAVVAIQTASFSSTTSHLEYGLFVLDHNNKWKDAYALTLRLHLELARVQFCRCNFDASKSFLDAILTNANSEIGKIGAYELLTLLKIARNQLNKSFRILSLALEKVWGDVPPDDVEGEVTKLRELLNGKSDSDLLMMPKISHRKILFYLFE